MMWFWACELARPRVLPRSQVIHRHHRLLFPSFLHFEPLGRLLCGKPDAQHRHNKDTQPSLPTDSFRLNVVVGVCLPRDSLSKSTRRPRRSVAPLYGHAHTKSPYNTTPSTTKTTPPTHTPTPHTPAPHAHTGIGRSPGSEAPVVATRPRHPNTPPASKQWHDSTSHSTRLF